LRASSSRDECQDQGCEEHRDYDAEGGAYADPVGQGSQDEGIHENGAASSDGEPRRGCIGVAWCRRDGRRDAEGVDAADAKPRYEEAGQGQESPRREPEQRKPEECQEEVAARSIAGGIVRASRLLTTLPA